MNSSMSLIGSSLFRRIELQQLMDLTARAFRKPGKRVWTLPPDKGLEVYAGYTAGHLREGVDAELLRRMNLEAYRVGKRLRRIFRIRTQEQAESLIFSLYKNIGIDMSGSIPGDIYVSRCYFCRHYTPEVCLAASALDEGIISGLAGKGALSFSQRLTDGCSCCRARFIKEEKL